MKSPIGNGVAIATTAVLFMSISSAQNSAATQQTRPEEQRQTGPAPASPDVVEGFEMSLGNSWTLDAEKQANISAERAHSGKQSLRFAYATSRLVPRATLQFQSFKACQVEFWLLVSKKGFRFSGWDSMGFGWHLTGKTKLHDGPLFVDFHWDQSIEGMTLQKPIPPGSELTPQTAGGDWVLWPLRATFPVGRWFMVRMMIQENRRVEFCIDGKHAGTITADPGEPIDGIEWGGGLSLQAMNYEVYLDDVRVSALVEDLPSKPEKARVVEELRFDPVITVQSCTMVPLLSTMHWSTGDCVESKGGRIVPAQGSRLAFSLRIGDRIATVGGKKTTLAAPPVALGGITYVPFSFVREALGAAVEVDRPGHRITISKGIKQGYLFLPDEPISLPYDYEKFLAVATRQEKLGDESKRAGQLEAAHRHFKTAFYSAILISNIEGDNNPLLEAKKARLAAGAAKAWANEFLKVGEYNTAAVFSSSASQRLREAQSIESSIRPNKMKALKLRLVHYDAADKLKQRLQKKCKDSENPSRASRQNEWLPIRSA